MQGPATTSADDGGGVRGLHGECTASEREDGVVLCTRSTAEYGQIQQNTCPLEPSRALVGMQEYVSFLGSENWAHLAGAARVVGRLEVFDKKLVDLPPEGGGRHRRGCKRTVCGGGRVASRHAFAVAAPTSRPPPLGPRGGDRSRRARLCVGLRRVARLDLVAAQAVKGGLRHDLARDPDRGAEAAPILVGRHVVESGDRLHRRACRGDTPNKQVNKAVKC